MVLQVAVPFGCPSFKIFPEKDLERGAVPFGRSSKKVLPKKDLRRGADPSKEVPDLPVLPPYRSIAGPSPFYRSPRRSFPKILSIHDPEG